MMKRILEYLSVLFIIAATGCFRGAGNQEPARIEGERLILRIERSWSMEKSHEIALRYGLDTLLMDSILEQVPGSLPDSVDWKVESSGKKFIEISKPVFNDDFSPFGANDILIFEEGWLNPLVNAPKTPERFGTNMLRNESVIKVEDSVAIFSLYGYTGAKGVILSGSFNSWNTLAIPMKKEVITDPGKPKRSITRWSTSVKLAPGKYSYRYIVDGRWTRDPDNLKYEQEEGRGKVSVFYMPNKIFELEGRSDARQVLLTGSFINWSRKGIPMEKSGDKWILPAYLKNGTWTYKFIADNEWLTDPVNPDTRSDASGNMNSFLSIGETYTFRLDGMQQAEKVVLTGSFNNWSENELVMEKSSEGWQVKIALEPGNWEYKFIADGEWMTDPENAFTTGAGDYINSLLVIRPNHTFVLEGFKDADNVIVTGSFNNWSRSDYRMIREGDTWKFPIHLEQGKCLYKFIVDGKWLTDPGNETWEDNEYGTGNSVLWIGK